MQFNDAFLPTFKAPTPFSIEIEVQKLEEERPWEAWSWFSTSRYNWKVAREWAARHYSSFNPQSNDFPVESKQRPRMPAVAVGAA